MSAESVEGAPSAIVLGAGAGGGSPQWNCGCAVCRSVRRGETAPRTQCGVAVSADGRRWALLNASPDLRTQLGQTPPLQPQQRGRHSPVEAVVLTGGEIDQVAGLLSMREGEPFSLYATPSIHDTLAQSAIFDAVDAGTVPRRRFELGEPLELTDPEVDSLQITVTPFAVPGKIPLYAETPGETPEIGRRTEDNIALQIQVGEATLFFVPCCAEITARLKRRVEGADVLLFDGTLWRDDELIEAGLADKTGRRMGHVSISGPKGVLQQFADVDIGRKILIHLNNSNPVLLEDSPERRAVDDAGWEVAFDGMSLIGQQ